MDSERWIRQALSEAEGPAEEGEPGSEPEKPTAGYLLRDEGTGCVIREATIEDAPALAAIGARSFHHAHAGFLDLSGLAGVAARFDLGKLRAQMREPANRFLVAMWEGSPIGFAHLRTGGEGSVELGAELPLEIQGIYVAPDWMGMGIGSALLRGTLELARELENGSLWSAVVEPNEGAVRFFHAWGFRVVGRVPCTMGRTRSLGVLFLARRTGD